MPVAPLQPGPLIIDIDGGLTLSPGDRARLQSSWVGGVILFQRNFQDRPQLRALTRDIKALRRPELLITVDQEGGRVQRFREPFTRLPPAALCGRLYDNRREDGRRLARNIGLVMASELLDCGVDLSFAPVLDVLQCDSRVIGDRAFHSDPEAVRDLAAAGIGGMRDAGMGSVGKHFPGHGGVGADSHTSLPEDGRTLAALRSCDLLPYQALADRMQGVMLAHVHYGHIDPQIPGYSPFWISDVLKNEIGFRGVIFSDDLSMAGAGDAPLAARCQAALQAGCDLLPVCNGLVAVDEFLREAQPWPGNSGPGPSLGAVSALYASSASATLPELEAARQAVQRAVAEMA